MSLAVSHLVGFGAGAVPASIVSTDHAVDTVDRSTYTFSSKAIGAAAVDRIVVVAVAYVTTTAITSVTIGGVSAAQVVAEGSSSNPKVELWAAVVPTGTTADIVVAHPGTSDREGIGVWAIYGASATVADTDHGTGTSPYADLNLNIPAGGVAIGAATDSVAGTQTYTWANLTENYDELVESPQDHTGASAAFVAAQTALAVTLTESSASTTIRMVLAAWGPK